MDQAESIAPAVQVLLATYNGERFLAEQIDSILAQDYPNLSILARDDGSTDGTPTLLERYAARYPHRFTRMPPSPPSGDAKWNFLHLMQAATADYLCLADQDDVWLPAKVTQSMQAMARLERQHGKPTPLLVFTDLRVVDQGLNEKYASFWRHQRIDPRSIHSFRRLLTQNVVTGCTALMNAGLCRLATRMPPEAYMHDWWIALVAAAFGAADYLPHATVAYRQHSHNVLGAVEHGRGNLVPRFRFHTLRRRQWETTERQAEGMLHVYGSELAPAKRALLQAYLRCETSPYRLVRTGTLLWHRFFQKGLRPNLAILWYLWDMEAAKRQQP